MDTGLDVLDAWSQDASPHDREAVYGALFAMADRTLLRTYRVLDDGLAHGEFTVLLRGGLVIKLHVHAIDSFGVTYIGPREHAPEVGGAHGTDQAAA